MSGPKNDKRNSFDVVSKTFSILSQRKPIQYVPQTRLFTFINIINKLTIANLHGFSSAFRHCFYWVGRTTSCTATWANKLMAATVTSCWYAAPLLVWRTNLTGGLFCHIVPWGFLLVLRFINHNWQKWNIRWIAAAQVINFKTSIINSYLDFMNIEDNESKR